MVNLCQLLCYCYFQPANVKLTMVIYRCLNFRVTLVENNSIRVLTPERGKSYFIKKTIPRKTQHYPNEDCCQIYLVDEIHLLTSRDICHVFSQVGRIIPIKAPMSFVKIQAIQIRFISGEMIHPIPISHLTKMYLQFP